MQLEQPQEDYRSLLNRIKLSKRFSFVPFTSGVDHGRQDSGRRKPARLTLSLVLSKPRSRTRYVVNSEKKVGAQFRSFSFRASQDSYPAQRPQQSQRSSIALCSHITIGDGNYSRYLLLLYLLA